MKFKNNEKITTKRLVELSCGFVRNEKGIPLRPAVKAEPATEHEVRFLAKAYMDLRTVCRGVRNQIISASVDIEQAFIETEVGRETTLVPYPKVES